MKLNTQHGVKTVFKRTQLLTALTAMVKKAGPERKLPTVRQLCRKFSVSSATLDRVLGEMESRNLIVRHHAKGIFGSPQLLRKNIAVVFGQNILTAASPFWRLVVQGIQQLAPKEDLHLRAYLDLSSATDGIASYADFVEDIEGGRLHGILLPNYLGPEQTARFRAYGLPMVVLSFADSEPWSVSLDLARTVELGVSELVAKGCRRIGLITAPGMGTHPQGNLFAQTLAERGLPYEGRWRYETAPLPAGEERPVDPFEEMGYQAIRSWIGGAFFDARFRANGEERATQPLAELPDGILITDEFITRGALLALAKAGLRPGHDIHLAALTTRGASILTGQAGEFTLLEIDPMHFAKAMLEMLLTLMNGRVPATDRIAIAPLVATAVALEAA